MSDPCMRLYACIPLHAASQLHAWLCMTQCIQGRISPDLSDERAIEQMLAVKYSSYKAKASMTLRMCEPMTSGMVAIGD